MRKPPAFVEKRLASLAATADDLDVASRSPLNEAARLREAIGLTRQRVKSSTIPAGPTALAAALHGDAVPADLTNINKQIGEAETKIEELIKTAGERRALAATAKQLWLRCREWVTGLPDTTRLVEVRPVDVSEESPKVALNRCRKEIIDLQADLVKVKASLGSMGELKAKAQAWVKDRAYKITIDAAGGRFVPKFKHHNEQQPNDNPNALGLLCSFFPQIVEKELLKRLSNDTMSMSDDEREQEVSRLKSAILAAERNEEALIGWMMVQGQIVHRRDSADPRAVLHCRVSERVEQRVESVNRDAAAHAQ